MPPKQETRLSLPRPIGVERLLRLPVPDIPQEQLAWYTPKNSETNNLQLKPPRPFVSQEVSDAIGDADGREFLGIDLGGNSIKSSRGKASNRDLIILEPFEPLQSKGGVGYLSYIEELAELTNGGRGLVIGISFAGKVDGTRPEEGTNIRTFQRELNEKYDGDMANIFPNCVRAVGAIDAGCGIAAAVMEALKQNSHIKKVVYVVNGEGMGGGVWINKTIIDADPGHVPVIGALNPFDRTVACGNQGSPTPDKTCVEEIGGSGQGVEQTFFEQTGQKLTGEQISAIHQNSNGEYPDDLSVKATEIYDAAIRVAVTGIVGLDQATQNGGSSARALDPETTMVVCQGGLFEVPGIGERMEQILEAHLKYKPRVIYAKDFSDNANIDGAAILALIS